MSDRGLWFPPDLPLRRSLAHDDPLPPPPFVVSLYLGPKGYERPYVVRSMVTGHALAEHIESRACAYAIADALNSAAARGLLGIEGNETDKFATRPYDETADAIGSYNDAVSAIGKRVKAGDPVPEFFLSKRRTDP